MRAIIAFSTLSQVSLAAEGDVFVCRRCRLGDSAADVWLGDDANVVDKHLEQHAAARHDGAAVAREKLAAFVSERAKERPSPAAPPSSAAVKAPEPPAKKPARRRSRDREARRRRS